MTKIIHLALLSLAIITILTGCTVNLTGGTVPYTEDYRFTEMPSAEGMETALVPMEDLYSGYPTTEWASRVLSGYYREKLLARCNVHFRNGFAYGSCWSRDRTRETRFKRRYDSYYRDSICVIARSGNLEGHELCIPYNPRKADYLLCRPPNLLPSVLNISGGWWRCEGRYEGNTSSIEDVKILSLYDTKPLNFDSGVFSFFQPSRYNAPHERISSVRCC